MKRIFVLSLTAALLGATVAQAQGPADPTRPGTSAASRTQTYDAVIVGAGPAGLVAAMSTIHRLRQDPSIQGRAPRVLVVEKRGDHAGGEALADAESVRATAFSRQQVIGVRPSVVSALATLGFRVPERFRLTDSAAVGGGSGTQPPAVSRDNPGRGLFSESSTHIISINELQHLLSRHAANMGVEFRYGTEVRGVEPGARVTRLLTRAGENGPVERVRARWIIGADGAGGSLRESIGLESHSGVRQGVMVGAWFDGLSPVNRVRYMNDVVPGRTGVLVGANRNQYGLFALPPELASVIDGARAERRDLTAAESRRIHRHIESVAVGLADGAAVPRVSRIMPFPVQLNRMSRTVSNRHRTIMVGDAVRSVNPLTGMGANISMHEGFQAGDAVVRRLRGDRQAMRQMQRRSNQLSTAIHAMSRDFDGAFQPPQSRPRARRPRVRRPVGAPLARRSGNDAHAVRRSMPRRTRLPRPRVR